jgi:hypothetical protein
MTSTISHGERASVASSRQAQATLDQLAPADVEALAALAGAPAGVAELAFDAFPDGTRAILITYELATEERDGRLSITERGRQAIELAAERFPEPYGDISLGDLLASTKRAIDRLVQQSGVRIREPSTHTPSRSTAASEARRVGSYLVQRVASSLTRDRQSKKPDDAEENQNAEAASAETQSVHTAH